VTTYNDGIRKKLKNKPVKKKVKIGTKGGRAGPKNRRR
tara:strand:+ start:1818 stop:1931 length:114 start_codon:yes stop_codon:yes gene_type:complete